MMGRKSNSVIGILAGTLVSGGKSGILDVATSSTSHQEPKNASPRGPKNFHLCGVGLGIVAALEKSGDAHGETPFNKALCDRNSRRSNPIPVTSPKNSSRIGREIDEMEAVNNSEEYTIVTFHGPNESHTKVYGTDHGQGGDNRTPFRIHRSDKCKRASVFHISPARFGAVPEIPAEDFLSSCDMCKKVLHGKDIYMYRGEKAFCSVECDRPNIDNGPRKRAGLNKHPARNEEEELGREMGRELGRELTRPFRFVYKRRESSKKRGEE